MNAVATAVTHNLAQTLLFNIRSQIERIVGHGMQPGAILMSGDNYLVMQSLLENSEACHNRDTDTVNGVQIIVMAGYQDPVVVPSPASMQKNGLL